MSSASDCDAQLPKTIACESRSAFRQTKSICSFRLMRIAKQYRTPSRRRAPRSQFALSNEGGLSSPRVGSANLTEASSPVSDDRRYLEALRIHNQLPAYVDR